MVNLKWVDKKTHANSENIVIIFGITLWEIRIVYAVNSYWYNKNENIIFEYNSGKIKKGQKVQIKLLNYPSDEFGELNGAVKSISLIPNEEGNYLVDVELPQNLKTTYDKTIPFRQEMKGAADIVTEDLRLIERFFYQLKNIIK